MSVISDKAVIFNKKVSASVLRFLGYWYFKGLWDNLLYFFYRNFGFLRDNQKLQMRFFWLDFKQDIKNYQAPPEDGCYCVLSIIGSNLTYVSEFCKSKEEANKLFDRQGTIVVAVSESERWKFIRAREALKRYRIVQLPKETKSTLTKKTLRKSTKKRKPNVRSSRNISRAK